jgi:hypothetical protein
MGIRLQHGVWAAAIGLSGAGADIMWPQEPFVAYGFFLAAGLLAIWGVRINGRHIWGKWWGSDDLGTPQPQTPLAPLTQTHSGSGSNIIADNVTIGGKGDE